MPTNDANTGGPDTDDTNDSADGGVLRRLARRPRTAAAVLILAGAALLVVALLLPPRLLTVLAALLAVAAIAVGAVLTVRASWWAAVGRVQIPVAGGAPGVIGPTTPLSPVRPGAPIRRRLGAAVVPIRVMDGPQPGGGALLIHARQDGVTLVGGDQVQVWRAARGGLEQPLVFDGSADVSGRFVLRRNSDRAVFLGTTRLTDVL